MSVGNFGIMAETSSNTEKQVTVKFHTNLPPDLKVPEDQLAVPTSVKRLALSKIINHLLGLESPKPFDFAIGGKLLRTTLQEFLETEAISVETVLDIEYLPIVAPPKTTVSAVHDEWVSAIDGSFENEVLSGSYDGAIRGWNDQLQCKWSFPAHETPITSVERLIQGSINVIFSSAQETSAKVWKLPENNEKDAKLVAVLSGHRDVIQSLSINPGQSACCSASWDGTAKIWPFSETLHDISGNTSDNTNNNGSTVAKKRKLEDGQVSQVADLGSSQVIAPTHSLQGHTGSVSSIAWEEEETIVTGGWDHSVRRWDTQTGSVIDTYHGNKVVLDVAPCGPIGPIAFVGADPVLKLWDPRDRAESTNLQFFKGHSNWVTAVEWSPGSEFHLITASYDESIRLWDVRGVVPLGTMNAHDDKVLCLDWVGTGRFVSGSADCTAKLHCTEIPV